MDNYIEILKLSILADFDPSEYSITEVTSKTNWRYLKVLLRNRIFYVAYDLTTNSLAYLVMLDTLVDVTSCTLCGLYKGEVELSSTQFISRLLNSSATEYLEYLSNLHNYLGLN